MDDPRPIPVKRLNHAVLCVRDVDRSVASIHDLAAGRRTLEAMGALMGQSDHGATKSLYGRDPDGNEFEVMWMVPRAQWGEHEHSAPIAPLDIEAEVARHG